MAYKYGKAHGGSDLPKGAKSLMDAGIPQRKAINMTGMGADAPKAGERRLPK